MTYVVVARWEVREGEREKVESILHDLVQECRKEPCVRPHRRAWQHRLAPQRCQKFAGERHDGDAAHPPLAVADALTEPGTQGAAGLILRPQPSQFDHGRTTRGLPAFLMPWSRSTDPVDQGPGAMPAHRPPPPYR